MSEKAMWEAIRPVMKRAGLDPERIENVVNTGTPDVNVTLGWIELKFALRWPPKEGPLRLDHFTSQQRSWLKRRKNAGGGAWVLLKVGKGHQSEWLLFDGWVAAERLGHACRTELYGRCLGRWTRLPKAKELNECLKK